MTIDHSNFQLGDWLKVYDHQPMDGRPDRYLEGRVIGISFRGTVEMPFPFYWLWVDKDVTFKNTPRPFVFVPMLVSQEYKERITILHREYTHRAKVSHQASQSRKPAQYRRPGLRG